MRLKLLPTRNVRWKTCREVVVRPIVKGTFTLHCVLARPFDMEHPAETQDHIFIVE
eukprot:gnl/Chilomastix_caulleri/8542.p3 GENE.gnl/Chilomastix_caulleri/8542~~gnl/Chilomastix_caulleri/8542.p3  ORF type:complete len:56 (+),score=7.46 gnl/Chilomastix_caulleri/8542:123-290(+)